MTDGSNPLRIYNTLTRTKEPFTPIDPANVRMYVCGPTVYDYAHIGNARPAIVFDVLFRLLRHVYGADHVTYVRNITDVDDKINARALRDYSDEIDAGRMSLNAAIRAVTEKTLAQYREEGGLAVRGARYARNCVALIEGMRGLGLRPFLAPEVQAPIIVTFHAPAHPAYDFKAFYERVRERGFILYPGKLTRVETFRVGCIGALGGADIEKVVAAVGETLREAGIVLGAG